MSKQHCYLQRRDSWRWSKSKQRSEYEHDITIYEMLKRAKKYFWASKEKKKKNRKQKTKTEHTELQV